MTFDLVLRGAVERDEVRPSVRARLSHATAPWRRRRFGVAVLSVVIAQAVIGLDLDVPVLRPVLALVTFVALPTLVVHRRARLPADSGPARLAYALGLALLGLILGGLLLDVALPAVGTDHPLAPAPLALAWLVADVALLAWRPSVPLAGPDPARTALRRVLDARFELAPTLAAVALVLSVAGAVRLNNGASGAVALAAVAVGSGALLVLLLGQGRSTARDAWVLGLVSVGLLLATSLRGWSITGHDIQAEFLAFRLTNEAQDWQMSALPSAYNACLSINILPTVLVQTTGLSGELVFKVLLQLVFATVPVLTYLLARRFLTRRPALAAAVLTMAFPTFFTDMSYLVRQEVAYLFLALMLLAATEPARTRYRSRLLVLVLGVGVIVSHYSTTYVLLMALVGALLGMGLLAAVRRYRHRPAHVDPGPPLVLLHPLVVAALVAVTLAWAGPVTHTGGHASDVVTESWRAVTGQTEDGPSSSDTSYWILGGDQTTPRERMNLFVDATLDYRDTRIPADERVIRHPRRAELRPKLHQGDTSAATDAARLGSAVLMQGFLLLGMVVLLRRRLRGTGPSREATLLACGALGAMAMVVLIPNLSVDYGVLRAFQQTLLVLAPVMALGMATVLRPFGSHLGRLLVAVVPVGLLLVLSGALPAILGAPAERMALANDGTYYDRFNASDSSLDAIDWLASIDHADRSNERIITNRNVNVRMLALSQNRAPVADRLYPTLLTNDAYVFVDAQIIEKGESTIFYTGDLLTYDYPIQDLDHELDLVYSGRDARIYR